MENSQKTASQMLHPERAACHGTWDVTKWLQISIQTQKEIAGDSSVLEMALREIVSLRHEVESLTRTIEDLQDTSWTRGSD